MAQRALPTITNPQQQLDAQKNSQVALASTIALPRTPIAPRNFSATSQRGGILLSWSPLVINPGASAPPSSNKISVADGYELLRSDNGSFAPGAYVSIALRDPSQTSYFDSLGGAVATKYYRLRATNGTASNPYSIHGIFTGTVKQSSIDASDTVTTPTTARDTQTTDATQTRAGAWRSGTLYPNQR